MRTGKVTMSALRLLLLPLSWLYGGMLRIRHALYNSGLLKSTRPAVPTIVIGNLALGGTGKTPMMELVLRCLAEVKPLATLSRGYGRSSTDLREVLSSDNATTVGDEPLQVKRKFPEVRVFVGADRIASIQAMMKLEPALRAVVLDDAFQHRRLNGGLNILLTTYQRPWHTDALLPAGRLRDVKSRAQAAQVVVVTKCPEPPTAAVQDRWMDDLGLHDRQLLFCSGIEYGKLATMAGESAPINDPRGTSLLLVTGIADPAPLVVHLDGAYGHVEHIAFPDHHPFSAADLARLADRYAKFAPGPKWLITTEKDAMRLRSVIAGSPLEGLPIAVIGMRAVILNEPERFEALIRHHVATHPAHR